jgi:uncharacterized RDD family membrane protein YckC
VETGLIGAASKERFLAAWFDAVVATIAALVVASLVPADKPLWWPVLMVGTYFAYFFVFEGVVKTTPGKFLFGLRVRRLSGRPCSIVQAAIRTVVRLLEVNPLLAGGLPAGICILATRRRQRIGDMLAGTVVVSVGSLAAAKARTS